MTLSFYFLEAAGSFLDQDRKEVLAKVLFSLHINRVHFKQFLANIPIMCPKNNDSLLLFFGSNLEATGSFLDQDIKEMLGKVLFSLLTECILNSF